MKIGYARVSTTDQNPDLQLDALKQAGCERIFMDKLTGTRKSRPKLQQMIKSLTHGDQVVIYRLDRLARSTRDLFNLVDEIEVTGASFLSLGEPWADTTSPAGKMILTVFAGLAEFERELMQSRMSDGRAAAKARGVKFGRPQSLNDAQKAEIIKMREQGKPVKEIAALFNVHKDTIYNLLKIEA